MMSSLRTTKHKQTSKPATNTQGYKKQHSINASNQQPIGDGKTASHLVATAVVEPKRNFWQIVRMIIMIKRALFVISLNANSNQPTHSTITSKKKAAAAAVLPDERPLFDINNFKRDKRKLPDEVRIILKMPSEKRTNEHVKLICAALRDHVSQFQEFPINIQFSIAKVAQLQEVEENRVIIRQNQIPHNYYFIVSGVASVYVLRRNVYTKEREDHFLAYLSKGESFGERALILGLTRNATVKSHTDIVLLSIEKDDYMNIFMSIKKGKEPEYITFLRDVRLLREWPVAQLPHNDARICLSSYFRKGAIVCSSSQANEWIYVIKQGTCRVLQSFEVCDEDRLEFFKPKDYSISNRERKNRDLMENEELIQTIINCQDIEGYIKEQKNKLSDSNRDCKQCYALIKRLNVKDVYGLNEIICDKDPNIEDKDNTRTLLVSDGSEVILINKEFFIKHMSFEFKNHLREKIQPYPDDIELSKQFWIQMEWYKYRKVVSKSGVNRHSPD